MEASLRFEIPTFVGMTRVAARPASVIPMPIGMTDGA
jgi:hypothetical protein